MRKLKFVLGAALVASAMAFAGCSVESASERRVVASSAGLSAEHLRRIETVLREDVDAGVRGGFVVAVADKNGIVYETAVGMADPYNGVPMATDTRFRIASMTKPIVTAAVMQLVDRGDIRLNDPVSHFIPAYADARVATSYDLNAGGEYETRAPSRSVTVHDLLTHMSGIGYAFNTKTDLDQAYIDANLFETEGTLAERIDLIAALPLYEDPGTKFRYSYAIDVAGRVVEVASGMTLEAYLKENMFEPLGMNDTEFFMDETDFERLAVVNEFTEDGEMVRSGETPLGGSINDEAFGVMSAGAGLVSSARDYARFMMMLLNEGTLDGRRILSPAAVRLMMSDNTPYDARPAEWQRQGVTFGIGGAVILEPGYTGNVAAKGEWGWGGYWDTSFAINPEDGVAAVLLAQTQPNQYLPPSRARDRVKAIVYGALE